MRKIQSMARGYLKPEYDSRASFYNKAETDDDKLYSYGTLVAEIIDGQPVLYPDWNYSQTTIRYVREWLRQHGFEAGSKSEIAAMYPVQNSRQIKSSNLPEDFYNRVVKGKEIIDDYFAEDRKPRSDDDMRSVQEAMRYEAYGKRYKSTDDSGQTFYHINYDEVNTKLENIFERYVEETYPDRTFDNYQNETPIESSSTIGDLCYTLVNSDIPPQVINKAFESVGKKADLNGESTEELSQDEVNEIETYIDHSYVKSSRRPVKSGWDGDTWYCEFYDGYDTLFTATSKDKGKTFTIIEDDTFSVMAEEDYGLKPNQTITRDYVDDVGLTYRITMTESGTQHKDVSNVSSDLWKNGSELPEKNFSNMSIEVFNQDGDEVFYDFEDEQWYYYPTHKKALVEKWVEKKFINSSSKVIKSSSLPASIWYLVITGSKEYFKTKDTALKVKTDLKNEIGLGYPINGPYEETDPDEIAEVFELGLLTNSCRPIKSEMDRTDLILALQGYIVDPNINVSDLPTEKLQELYDDLFGKKTVKSSANNGYLSGNVLKAIKLCLNMGLMDYSDFMEIRNKKYPEDVLKSLEECAEILLHSNSNMEMGRTYKRLMSLLPEYNKSIESSHRPIKSANDYTVKIALKDAGGDYSIISYADSETDIDYDEGVYGYEDAEGNVEPMSEQEAHEVADKIKANAPSDVKVSVVSYSEITSSRRLIKSERDKTFWNISNGYLTPNKVMKIMNEIDEWCAHRALTHSDIKGYSDNEIQPGEASEAIREIITYLEDLAYRLDEYNMADDEDIQNDNFDDLLPMIQDAEDICQKYLTEETYSRVYNDIFKDLELVGNRDFVNQSFIVCKESNGGKELYCIDNSYHSENDMSRPEIKIFNSKPEAEKIAKRSKTGFVQEL